MFVELQAVSITRSLATLSFQENQKHAASQDVNRGLGSRPNNINAANILLRLVPSRRVHHFIRDHSSDSIRPRVSRPLSGHCGGKGGIPAHCMHGQPFRVADFSPISTTDGEFPLACMLGTWPAGVDGFWMRYPRFKKRIWEDGRWRQSRWAMGFPEYLSEIDE